MTLVPADRDLIAGWVEYGIPDNSSTLEHAAKLFGRLQDELGEWQGIVYQLLDLDDVDLDRLRALLAADEATARSGD